MRVAPGFRDLSSPLLDQPVMGSVECQFQAGGNAELVKNIGEVVFNGLRTESQPVGDILIRTP